MKSIFYTILLLSLFGMFLGCKDGGPKTATVTGNVTIDGEPIPQGEISFEAPDGAAAGGAGTIVDGKYTAKVPLGEKVVRISGYKVDGQRVADPGLDDRMIDNLVPIVPENYWGKSELHTTVKSGSQEVNFDLTKTPAKK